MMEQFFTPTPSSENNSLPKFRGKNANFLKRPLLAVIYAGHDSVVFTVYTAPDLKYLLARKQKLNTHSPQTGWREQDPAEIMAAVYNCCTQACIDLIPHGYMRADIEGVSITNERETIVVWNGRTGKPLYPAIAANDARATAISDRIVAALPKRDQNYFKSICGLTVRPNYAALKLLWLQENVDDVRQAVKGGFCKFGSLDSWIVWNLTKGSSHVTDVTNASYSFLMNIKTLKWDPALLNAFAINNSMLPQICCCGEVSAYITESLCVLKGWRITGIIADQQALLLGQTCYEGGKLNVDLNRNCRLLYNIGSKCITSSDAITTVALKMDKDSQCLYALEGGILGCERPLEWLEKNVHILPYASAAGDFAQAVRSTNSVYFVPAFSGLNSPYWRREARGVVIGLSAQTNKFHVVRAALEAICFQIYDVVESMRTIGDFNQDVIYAAGPYASQMLMQMLSDLSGVVVVCFNIPDPVSYGAAICGGYTIKAVDMHRIKQGIWRKSIDYRTCIPLIRPENRIKRYTEWRQAVTYSINWMRPRKTVERRSVARFKDLKGSKDNEMLNAPLIGFLGLTSMLFLLKGLKS